MKLNIFYTSFLMLLCLITLSNCQNRSKVNAEKATPVQSIPFKRVLYSCNSKEAGEIITNLKEEFACSNCFNNTDTICMSQFLDQKGNNYYKYLITFKDTLQILNLKKTKDFKMDDMSRKPAFELYLIKFNTPKSMNMVFYFSDNDKPNAKRILNLAN